MQLELLALALGRAQGLGVAGALAECAAIPNYYVDQVRSQIRGRNRNVDHGRPKLLRANVLGATRSLAKFGERARPDPPRPKREEQEDELSN